MKLSESPILTESKDGVYAITVNRPDKLNSITGEMLDLISGALDKADGDKDIRCVVIKGAGGRAFSAGADIKDFLTMDKKAAKDISRKGQKAFKKIIELTKPVVAAVQGYALGGGCELACHCDYRLASDKARFSQPEVTLGLMPGWGGTYILKRLVGDSLALEMITTGRRLNAEEALSAGLVNAVYPVEEFDEKVDEFVQGLVKGPPLSLVSMKKLITRDQLDEAMEAEAELFSNLWNTSDLKEGLTAFTEKRKPEFKGK